MSERIDLEALKRRLRTNSAHWEWRDDRLWNDTSEGDRVSFDGIITLVDMLALIAELVTARTDLASARERADAA